MTKRIFSLFLFLLAISFYQCNDLINKNESITIPRPPSNITVTNVTYNSAYISWNPVIGSGHTVSYNIVGQPSSGGTIYTSNTAITITGLSRCTNYEVRVSNVQAGGGYSNPIYFTTPMWYCMDNPTGQATPNLYISNVTVNATGLPPMVSNSGGTSYFTNYRADVNRKVKLVIGSTNNTVSVTKAGTYAQNPTTVNVLIDFDGSGNYFDSNTEAVLKSVNSTASTVTATFDVPTQVSQAPCKGAMRVVTNPTFAILACGGSGTGEIEDYEIEFVDATSLDLNEVNKNKEINIYPNPVSDILNISGISSGNDFEIYNTVGQKISEGKILENKVNVHHLIKGTYFLQIKDKENVTRLKFIKN